MLFFDSPDQWERIATALRRAGDAGDFAGLDTEFYGYDWATATEFDYDPSSISPVGRTRVYVWSVAVPTRTTTPRGYRKAHAAVLPEQALEYKGLRDWLCGGYPKCCHNLPSDQHTLGNHGIDLDGGRDTLAVARWCWPERAGLPFSRKPYNLKTLATELLGYDVTTTFDDFMEPNLVETQVVRSRCVCGVEGCRKRKEPHGQYKANETVVVERGKKPIQLRQIDSSHPLWLRFVDYAAQDAAWAVELNDLAMAQRQEIPYTWPTHH